MATYPDTWAPNPWATQPMRFEPWTSQPFPALPQTSTAGTSVSVPLVTYCPQCDKVARVRSIIVKKTTLADGHEVADKTRSAAHCDDHGVVAWLAPK